jgi:hypothetical protein
MRLWHKHGLRVERGLARDKKFPAITAAMNRGGGLEKI